MFACLGYYYTQVRPCVYFSGLGNERCVNTDPGWACLCGRAQPKKCPGPVVNLRSTFLDAINHDFLLVYGQRSSWSCSCLFLCEFSLLEMAESVAEGRGDQGEKSSLSPP